MMFGPRSYGGRVAFQQGAAGDILGTVCDADVNEYAPTHDWQVTARYEGDTPFDSQAVGTDPPCELVIQHGSGGAAMERVVPVPAAGIALHVSGETIRSWVRARRQLTEGSTRALLVSVAPGRPSVHHESATIKGAAAIINIPSFAARVIARPGAISSTAFRAILAPGESIAFPAWAHHVDLAAQDAESAIIKQTKAAGGDIMSATLAGTSSFRWPLAPTADTLEHDALSGGSLISATFGAQMGPAASEELILTQRNAQNNTVGTLPLGQWVPLDPQASNLKLSASPTATNVHLTFEVVS